MSNTSAVVQKDRKGNIIGVFGSIKLAHEVTGVSYLGISGAIRKKQKTSGGFIWEYAKKKEQDKQYQYSQIQKQKKEIKLKPGETLCCHCDTCSPECSWKRCFKPVEGWKAKLNAKKTSYIVSVCPMFSNMRG